MESEVMGNYHASFGERGRETRMLRDMKVRSAPTPLSPLLMNVALHGLETVVVQKLSRRLTMAQHQSRRRIKPTVVRYADDLVVLDEDEDVIKQAQEIISVWLADMGLELKPSKTRITHTLKRCDSNKGNEGSEGDEGSCAKPGFDFLGYEIRQYPVGKRRTGYTGHGVKGGLVLALPTFW